MNKGDLLKMKINYYFSAKFGNVIIVTLYFVILLQKLLLFLYCNTILLTFHLKCFRHLEGSSSHMQMSISSINYDNMLQ